MIKKLEYIYGLIKNENKLYKSFLSPLWGSLGSSKTHGKDGKQKKQSRVYDPILYSAIYQKSYEIIMDTKDTLEQLGLSVLYMHTDSVFIKVPKQETYLFGIDGYAQYLTQHINRKYKYVNIKLENIFSKLILKGQTYIGLTKNDELKGGMFGKKICEPIKNAIKTWMKNPQEYDVSDVLSTLSTHEEYTTFQKIFK